MVPPARRARMLCRLLPLFLAVACAPLAGADEAGGPDPAAREATAYAGRMVARVNWHRHRAGMGAIVLSGALNAAATGHARAMASNDFFSHDAPDGIDFATRAARAGYRWRLIAENLSAGIATPESTVDGWMESEGHRRNMLTRSFRDAGVGHAFLDPDPGEVRYGHYWVLMLGAPADGS